MYRWCKSFIKIWQEDHPSIVGIGECGPLPGLSIDPLDKMEEVLKTVCKKIQAVEIAAIEVAELVPKEFPSIAFGLEMALLDLQNGGRRILFDNGFVLGTPLPINGLIWMGGTDFMLSQITEKIEQGFTCIKLKVGGLNFERECDLLKYIRSKYYDKNITIRLDANGAFKPEEALLKLNILSKYGIHSIEQPIKQGLPEMEMVCKESPIPIALDEELIGIYDRKEKEALLKRIQPQYIILKPTLHGGFKGCEEWIAMAASMNIGWWITSALESNIGLNAICQFTANYKVTLPQGLGTGMLYENNFPSPLEIDKGKILYNRDRQWQIEMP